MLQIDSSCGLPLLSGCLARIDMHIIHFLQEMAGLGIVGISPVEYVSAHRQTGRQDSVAAGDGRISPNHIGRQSENVTPGGVGTGNPDDKSHDLTL